jgi:hypothetical protein
MGKGIISKVLQFSAACLISSSVMAAGTPVDLTGWTANGSNGTWTVQGGNDSVFQSVNSARPTVFHNGQNSQGLALSGEITVQTTSDNDFIGFVLGYNEGDVSNASADYILIDWKQADQTDQGGLGKDGLAISRVTGALQSGGTHGGNDAWTHTGVVQELARANTLGSTGWLDNTKYSFDLIFTSTQIQVSVNDIVQLSINGLFNNGSFGFYNFSQTNVLYAGIEERTAPPIGEVPVPAAVFMFAPALLGFLGLRRRKAQS